MHGLDHSWSKLFLLASHSMKSSCTSRLSLRNTEVLLQNRTPASAAMPRISLWGAPEVLTHHTTGDLAQESPSQGLLYDISAKQTTPFHPSRDKIALRELHLLCISTLSLLLPYFPHPCQILFFLPLIQDTVLQFSKGLFLGTVVMALQAVNSLAHLQALPWAALRTTASPNILLPQFDPRTPMSLCPPWMFAAHGTQAILPVSPFDSIPSASYLNCFLSLCQGFSMQVVVTSLFLLHTMRTLFQQVFLTLQKAAVTQ